MNANVTASDGETLALSSAGGITINLVAMFTVDSGGSLTVDGGVADNGAIVNLGTLTVKNSGRIDGGRYGGMLNNSGATALKNVGPLTGILLAPGALFNKPSGTITILDTDPDSTCTSVGMPLPSQCPLPYSCTLENSGTVDVENTNGDGVVIGGAGKVVNSGTVNVMNRAGYGVVVGNLYGNVTNLCSGTISIGGSGSFSNSRTVTNSGTITGTISNINGGSVVQGQSCGQATSTTTTLQSTTTTTTTAPHMTTTTTSSSAQTTTTTTRSATGTAATTGNPASSSTSSSSGGVPEFPHQFLAVAVFTVLIVVGYALFARRRPTRGPSA